MIIFIPDGYIEILDLHSLTCMYSTAFRCTHSKADHQLIPDFQQVQSSLPKLSQKPEMQEQA
jgi:hypothetical protein